MSTYKISQRPDGKWAFNLNQPFKKPLHIPKTLTPSFIPRINEEMVRKSAGAAGKFESWVLKTLYSHSLPEKYEKDLQGIDEEIYVGTIDSWKKPMSILADESFVNMILAASISAPETNLIPEELLAPSGTVFFEKPIILKPLFSSLDESTTDPAYLKLMNELPIRGFHWGEMPFYGIGFFFLADGKIAQQYNEEIAAKGSKENPFFPKELYHSLATISFNAIPWDFEEELHVIVKKSVALLRALKAISESPITTSRKVQAVENLGKKRNRRQIAKPKTTEIQLLSLRRPKEANRELKAATGIKQRAHWVRGHWRNQWYPKKEKHEAIWVEGFAKGDPSLGVVPRERVYLAKGD